MHNKPAAAKKSRIDTYYSNSRCILCGKEKIDSGRIFRGQCVCSTCFRHIHAIPVSASILPDVPAAAESAALYTH